MLSFRPRSLILLIFLVLCAALPGRLSGDARAQQSVSAEVDKHIKALKDENPFIRNAATQALVGFGPEAVAPLIEALKDKEARVRNAAAQALGRIGPEAKAAVQALIDALKDKKVGVRYAATRALGRIGPEAVALLINALKDKEERVRNAVGRALGRIGPEAVALLIDALKDKEARVRNAAARALGRIGPEAKAAVPALIEALTDKVVRAAAADGLGSIGPEAVAPLIEALKDKDPGVRYQVAFTLGRIGPEAKAAVQALIDALKDKEPGVRYEAAQALGRIGPEAKAAVPALIETLKDKDPDASYAAAEALGGIGVEAKAAVPALIDALKDKDSGVHDQAAQALGRIGPEAKAAVQTLIDALKDKEPGVREAAAQALGRIGSEAKDAVPALSQAVNDVDELFGRVAGKALARIATALQDAGTTDAIEDLKKAGKVLAAHPDEGIQQHAEPVRRAVKYLKLVKEEEQKKLWRIVLKWIEEHPRTSLGIGVYIAFPLTWLLLLWLRPLWLLRINDVVAPFTDFKLPSWLGGMKVPLSYVILVRFFSYRARVLDAWVADHIEPVRNNFFRKRTVKDRRVHISLPVILDGKARSELSGNHLRPAFESNLICLLIWGEGGAGKTSLACQLAKRAIAESEAERFCDHLMIPVLIEDELDLEVPEGKHRFTEAIRRQLQTLADEPEPITEQLLEHLLRRKRVLVIVDHLSEMGEDTRSAINPQLPDFPTNALIVTSRRDERLGGVTKTVINPLRIDGDHLSEFMGAYLRQHGKRDLFDDSEFFDGCSQLSRMVGDRNITPLFAKLFVDQMIAHKEGRIDEKALPSNIPNLMLGYLNELNRNVMEDRLDDRAVHRDAKVIAWRCLEPRFRPGPGKIDDVTAALDGDDAETRLGYLESRLRIIETIQPAKDQIRFTLDPLAEYLAGLYLVETNGNDEELWRAFLTEADEKPGAPEAIKEFLQAILECCEAKGTDNNVPDFVAEELIPLVGLDPDVVERQKLEERVRRLISDLSLPDKADVLSALERLGRIGPNARGAVPKLSETLKDKDEEVSWAAYEVLKGLGPEARAAVPAFIENLKNKEAPVRARAAYLLGRIGPEAKAAVPALIEALKDKVSSVRSSAVTGLGGVGPEAKAAVPVLIEALKHKDASVRQRVAFSLERIGPEAKAVVPALIEALKDKDARVRQRVAFSLGRIDLAAEAAVPALKQALKDKDEAVREAADAALRKITGSENDEREEDARSPEPGEGDAGH